MQKNTDVAAVGNDDCGHVCQIVLALIVCGFDASQRFEKFASVKAVDAGVDLFDLAFFFSRVSLFDDFLKGVVLIANDASVAGRVLEANTQNRTSGARRCCDARSSFCSVSSLIIGTSPDSTSTSESDLSSRCARTRPRRPSRVVSPALQSSRARRPHRAPPFNFLCLVTDNNDDSLRVQSLSRSGTRARSAASRPARAAPWRGSISFACPNLPP